jgi:hypothetical protein
MHVYPFGFTDVSPYALPPVPARGIFRILLQKTITLAGGRPIARCHASLPARHLLWFAPVVAQAD